LTIILKFENPIFSADGPPDSKRNRRKAGKTEGIFFLKNSFKNSPEKFFRGRPVRFQKESTKSRKNRGNFFSKSSFKNSPEKFFRGWPVRFQKESTKSRKNRENIFFQKILSKTARKSFSADGLSDFYFSLYRIGIVGIWF